MTISIKLKLRLAMKKTLIMVSKVSSYSIS